MCKWKLLIFQPKHFHILLFSANFVVSIFQIYPDCISPYSLVPAWSKPPHLHYYVILLSGLPTSILDWTTLLHLISHQPELKLGILQWLPISVFVIPNTMAIKSHRIWPLYSIPLSLWVCCSLFLECSLLHICMAPPFLLKAVLRCFILHVALPDHSLKFRPFLCL